MRIPVLCWLLSWLGKETKTKAMPTIDKQTNDLARFMSRSFRNSREVLQQDAERGF
jgi:hypothetical protein